MDGPQRCSSTDERQDTADVCNGSKVALLTGITGQVYIDIWLFY